jgi:hypothetical protein
VPRKKRILVIDNEEDLPDGRGRALDGLRRRHRAQSFEAVEQFAPGRRTW